jgi:hypothetical protein
VENGASVKIIAGILQKISGGNWRFIEIQFNGKIAHIGAEGNHKKSKSKVSVESAHILVCKPGNLN